MFGGEAVEAAARLQRCSNCGQVSPAKITELLQVVLFESLTTMQRVVVEGSERSLIADV
jgi:hypothetical protein